MYIGNLCSLAYQNISLSHIFAIDNLLHSQIQVAVMLMTQCMHVLRRAISRVSTQDIDCPLPSFSAGDLGNLHV